jgi:hypothetical protein
MKEQLSIDTSKVCRELTTVLSDILQTKVGVFIGKDDVGSLHLVLSTFDGTVHTLATSRVYLSQKCIAGLAKTVDSATLHKFCQALVSILNRDVELTLISGSTLCFTSNSTNSRGIYSKALKASSLYVAYLSVIASRIILLFGIFL